MFCPLCGARTEVTEKRGPFRDRRCTNAACRLDFTTRESVMTVRERRRLCARTRATKIDPPPRPLAASAEARSTSYSGAGVPPDPRKGASGIQEKTLCLQAGVSA